MSKMNNKVAKAFSGLLEKAENDAIVPSTIDIFNEEDNGNIAPAGVILAQVVEKSRNGNDVTTYELASVVNRLAFTELSEEEIARRFSKAFEDVLIRD